MSRSSRTATFTGKILVLESTIENGDKKGFLEGLKENRLSLHNCSCGDSFLGEQYNKVLRKALEKFL